MTEAITRRLPSGDGEYGNAGLTPHRVNEMLEEQFRRIAHAVHDEAGQILSAVFLRLDQAARELPPDCASCFQEIKQMLELIEQQLRDLAHDLRSPVLDDLGLVPAIECLSDRVSQRFELAVSVTSSIPERLPLPIETALFRVVQECLTNIAKDGTARQVRIRLNQDGDVIRGSVHDDGAGFDLDEVLKRKGTRGLRLVGMWDRIESVGGHLSIQSRPGYGTELLITIPWGTRNGNWSTACG